jgi:flagellar biosynthetic protein FliR
MPNFGFSEAEVLAFALVLIRISAFIVAWPVFSIFSLPNSLKVLLALALSFLLFPSIAKPGVEAAGWDVQLPLIVVREALIGLVLGGICRAFHFAVSIGGNLVALNMGLASAQMYNPTLNSQTTIVEQFYLVFGTMIFFALNGHHLMIAGLAQSFDVLPLGLGGIGVAVSTDMAAASAQISNITNLIHEVLVAGVKISAPVIVAIFCVNVAMGILGRAVPQINVLITSLPVTVLVGLLVTFAAIPALGLVFREQILAFSESFIVLLRGM